MRNKFRKYQNIFVSKALKFKNLFSVSESLFANDFIKK